jgi:hypothetical protein
MRCYKQYNERRHVKNTLRHVSGPKKLHLKDNEIAVILLGRNVSYYLDDFIEHHRALGAEYLVYIDNGSSDDSLNRATKYSNTVVATCSANFRQHQDMMRYFSATLFVEGGWRLSLDADEMFDYLGANHMAMPDLTRYLATEGQNGLVAQMLEMVPPGTLPPVKNLDYRNSREVFQSYSLGNITKFDYHSEEIKFNWLLSQNNIPDDSIKIMFGGLRRTLFGEDCCLTKHPLFRVESGVSPMLHPHVSTGLRCANFTSLIRHYKFAGDMLNREQNLLLQNRITHAETALRVTKLSKDKELSFLLPDSQFSPTPESLLEQEFLVASKSVRKAFLR